MKTKRRDISKTEAFEDILYGISSSMIDTSPKSSSESSLEDYELLLEKTQCEENKAAYQANNENKLNK